MPKFTSPFTTWVNIVLAALALLVVAFFLWWFLVRPGQLAQEAKQAEASNAFGQNRVATSQQAQGKSEEINQRNEDYDKVTEQGNHDIRNAEGSNVLVSDASSCTAIRSICVQRSYKDSERCRTLLQSCPS